MLVTQRMNVVSSICLAFTILGPSNAVRRITNLDTLHSLDQSNASARNEKWGKAHCPKGLTEVNTKACGYPDKSGQITSVFTTYSPKNLLFNKSTGTYMTTAQFIAEFGAAFSDKAMKRHVGGSLAHIEMQRNATFKNLVAAVNKTEFSQWEEVEDELRPAYFYVESQCKDEFFELAEVGFEGLETAAETGAILGIESEGVASAAAGGAAVAAFFSEFLLPIMFPIEVIMTIRETIQFYHEKTENAEAFAKKIVMKSDCMITKLTDEATSVTAQPLVEEVCGPRLQAGLENQFRASIAAMAEVFKTIASFGRCTFPHGEHAWSKVNCLHGMYNPLHESGGQTGVLFSALSLMAYYGFRLDELMDKPLFSSWYEKNFGIMHPAGTVSMVPKLTEAKGLEIHQKWPVCMQLIATHRAFERVFQRMSAAIKVWTRSFAQPLRSLSIRDTWWPCPKVFNELGDDSAESYCKQYDWKTGSGLNEKPIDEGMACKQAEEFPADLWDFSHGDETE